ncbi:MAG: hypothetical protein K2K63_11130 [Acetatifactor sp.]|nr:hypothetical protein [Acetatifactor sp.]
MTITKKIIFTCFKNGNRQTVRVFGCMRVQTPTAGIWTFVVEAARDMDIHNGRFNMWLPIRQFLNTEVIF